MNIDITATITELARVAKNCQKCGTLFTNGPYISFTIFYTTVVIHITYTYLKCLDTLENIVIHKMYNCIYNIGEDL